MRNEGKKAKKGREKEEKGGREGKGGERMGGKEEREKKRRCYFTYLLSKRKPLKDQG